MMECVQNPTLYLHNTLGNHSYIMDLFKNSITLNNAKK